GLTRPATGGPITILAIPGLQQPIAGHAPPVTAQNAQFGVAPPNTTGDRSATHISESARGYPCGVGRLAAAVAVWGCSIGAACPGNGGQEDVSTQPAGLSARYRR